MRDKLAEFLILIAVNWIASPEYRKWYNEESSH